MRDPARIDRILDKLKIYWHKNPDLRLGQLVYNLSPVDPVILRSDVFYLEDNKLEEALDHES